MTPRSILAAGLLLSAFGTAHLKAIAADLFYDDVADEWRAYVSNFSTTGDVLNRRAKGGLNCAWSKACPLFGVSVMRAKSLGFDGMNEDPDGRAVLLTFDRVNFPGMPKPNWTYGGLYLYERRIR